jgi:tagatose 6-phosphate kinase
MSGDVIVTVTLNAALYVSYTADGLTTDGAVTAVSRPRYQAGGRGVTVARVLQEFGHEVLAAGLAGGVAGELIGQDLARAGVPAGFTQIRGESRRIFRFEAASGVVRYGEPGPYITTEELGRFAADYRRLLASAAAVVLSGSLPDGLPPDMYASLVRYAAEAGVPAILDAGGEELVLAARNRPDLVVAEARGPDAGQALLRHGAAAAAVISGDTVRVVTGSAEWTGSIAAGPLAQAASAPPAALPAAVQLDRGALVAGLVPGGLLGWSWPDRLRNAVALAAAVTSTGPGEAAGEVDLRVYETLLDKVTVTP